MEMEKPILGIQLYTLRDFCQNAQDFQDTLSYLSDLGVLDVQISAIGPIDAKVQKEILEKTNMRVCVTHKPFDRFLNDIDGLIEEHKVIECDAPGLGCPSEEYRESLSKVDHFISTVNTFLPVLKENGMAFHYHNHDFEFHVMENGMSMYDYLIANTDPESFFFIPDVAWIHYAGQDPAAYIRKLKDRIKVCHFKDYDIIDGERKFVTLGEGRVDLKACYEACKECGIPYIMYEQDGDWVDGDAKKATAMSWAYMRKIAEEA